MKKVNLYTLAIAISIIMHQSIYGQNVAAKEQPVYTIENCVNEFDINKAKETKSGYQYWFADKNFTQENTLKMSIVAPGKSTHAPHRHPEEEFFLHSRGKSFILS